MRDLILFLSIFLLISSCKKDDDMTPDNIDTPPIEMAFNGSIDQIEGIEMNCELFVEMYLSKTLDFGSWNALPNIDPHIGTIKLNDDGTISNLWEGDQAFLSWEYLQFGDDIFCSSLRIRLLDDESGEVKQVIFTLGKYFEDSVQFTRLDNGSIYSFFPID